MQAWICLFCTPYVHVQLLLPVFHVHRNKDPQAEPVILGADLHLTAVFFHCIPETFQTVSVYATGLLCRDREPVFKPDLALVIVFKPDQNEIFHTFTLDLETNLKKKQKTKPDKSIKWKQFYDENSNLLSNTVACTSMASATLPWVAQAINDSTQSVEKPRGNL